jgi:hypothetical protein
MEAQPLGSESKSWGLENSSFLCEMNADPSTCFLVLEETAIDLVEQPLCFAAPLAAF